MDERSGQSMTMLRALISARNRGATADAAHVALGMSVAAVASELDDEFLDAYARECSDFFQVWLAQMSPFERMAAAQWVGGEYLQSMVHLEDARGSAARLTLAAMEAATAQLAHEIEDFWPFTDGPDTEVPVAVADQLKDLASRVREVHAGIVAASTQIA